MFIAIKNEVKLARARAQARKEGKGEARVIELYKQYGGLFKEGSRKVVENTPCYTILGSEKPSKKKKK